METNSLPETPENDLAILESQIRECYGRVVYSHKTHEKQADILKNRDNKFKWFQIILSALTTGSIASTFFGTENLGILVGTIFSTILLAINAYLKNNDLGELAEKHKNAANSIWIIREKYFSLLTDIKMKLVPIEVIIGRRDKLLEDLDSAYKSAPQTTFEAYKKAQDALKILEDMTFTDAEIDKFLPQNLKREPVKREK